MSLYKVFPKKKNPIIHYKLTLQTANLCGGGYGNTEFKGQNYYSGHISRTNAKVVYTFDYNSETKTMSNIRQVSNVSGSGNASSVVSSGNYGYHTYTEEFYNPSLSQYNGNSLLFSFDTKATATVELYVYNTKRGSTLTATAYSNSRGNLYLEIVSGSGQKGVSTKGNKGAATSNVTYNSGSGTYISYTQGGGRANPSTITFDYTIEEV